MQSGFPQQVQHQSPPPDSHRGETFQVRHVRQGFSTEGPSTETPADPQAHRTRLMVLPTFVLSISVTRFQLGTVSLACFTRGCLCSAGLGGDWTQNCCWIQESKTQTSPVVKKIMVTTYQKVSYCFWQEIHRDNPSFNSLKQQLLELQKEIVLNA